MQPNNEWFPGSLEIPMSERVKKFLQSNRERLDKYQRELTTKNRYFYAMLNEMDRCGSGRIPIKMKRFRKFRRYQERQLGIKEKLATFKWEENPNKSVKQYMADWLEIISVQNESDFPIVSFSDVDSMDPNAPINIKIDFNNAS